MMEPELKPDARLMRLVLIPPAAAIGVLWAVQYLGFVPQPWMAVRLLCKDLFGIIMKVAHPNYQFHFNGHWVTPGWRYFPMSLHYIAHSGKDSLTVAGALLIGGIVAVIADRLAIKWNTQMMRSIK